MKFLKILCFALITTLSFAGDLLQMSGNNYINIGTPDKLQIPDNHPFTIEAWIRPSTISGTRIIYSKNNGRSGTYTYIFGLLGNSTELALYTGAGGTPSDTWRSVLLPAQLKIGQWYHLACSFNGTDVTFYLNGVPLGLHPLPYGFANYEAHNVKIGGYSNNTDFQGNIREVRVWNRARSHEELLSSMHHRLSGDEFALLGYWPLNEGSGLTATDLSRDPAPGTITETTWVTTDLPPSAAITDTLFISGNNGLFGTPTPDYGAITNLSHNATLTCTAPADWQLERHNINARARCTGYKLYTNSIAPPFQTADTTSFIYTHSTNYPLTQLLWQWQMQYQITATSDIGGTISTNSGWFDKDETVTITATPAPGYDFYRWSGDVPSGQETSSSITLEVSNYLTVRAEFTPSHTGTGNAFFVSSLGSDSNSGSSWTHAKLTVGAAINQAVDGDTIYVAGGNYPITATLIVDKKLFIFGVEGPHQSTIYRSANTIRILELSHNDALFTGFTLSGGNVGSAAGINITAGTVSNSVVTGCTGNRGSIVGMSGGLFTHGIIENNVENGNSGGTGGASLNNSAVIAYTTLRGNRSGSSEGGNSALILAGSSLATHCIITNNLGYSPATRASVAVTVSGNATMYNCLIAQNHSRGVDLSGSGRISHSTVADNYVYGNSGNGLYISGGNVENSIIYGNGTVAYPAFANDILRSGGTITYSCSGVLQDGTGNTSQPPLFVNPSQNNYHLLPGSSAIDSGTLSKSVTDDLNGNPRPTDGNGDTNAAYDMGCYEAPAHNQGELRAGFTVTLHDDIGSLSTTFTPHVLGEGSSSITSYIWDFGDGTTLSTDSSAPVTHSFNPGFFTVTLTVITASDSSFTAVMPDFIRVAGTSSYVSTTGANIPPYHNWENAAHNVQDAINALIRTNNEVRTVYVTNGTYITATEIEIIAPLHLISINGPEHTILEKSGGNRLLRSYLPESFISGFTLTKASDTIHVAGGVVSNCFIMGNTANRGNMIHITGNTGLLTHSVIANNFETGNSGGNGGVRIDNGATMRNCVITGNRAGSNDNCTMALDASGVGTLAENCIITNNLHYSPTKPGYTVVLTGGASLRSSLIANNQGRGADISGTATTLDNCTVVGNIYYGNVGNGVSISGGSVVNSIIWNNGTDNSQNLNRTGGNVLFSNTNPLANGGGNLNVDPVFADVSKSDYRLAPESTLINAGTNLLWITEASLDLAGAPRIIANQVDIGCYEAPDPDDNPLICNFDSSAVEGISDLEVAFTAIARGQNTNIVSYLWDFGDGNTHSGSDAVTVTNHYQSPGYFNVTLTLINTAEVSATHTKNAYIYIAPLTAYVTTNGLGIAPYTTWEHAATNIQDAINIARNFDGQATTVVVSNGLYSIAAQLELLKPITLRSVNGRDVTTIRRVASTERVVWLNDDNTILDGFTLENGLDTGVLLTRGSVYNCAITGSSAYRNGGGMIIEYGSASNCLFYGNYDSGRAPAGGAGDGAGGVRMTGGLLTHSAIFNNYGGTGGSPAGGLMLGGGLAQNTIISGNWLQTAGTAGGVVVTGTGTLRNCLVMANSANGINHLSGIIENCTVVRNELIGINHTLGNLINTISYFNGISDLSGTGTDFNNICASDITTTAGNGNNITADPLFVIPGTGYGLEAITGNYRIKGSSPCINAGADEAWMSTATDLDGKPRRLGARVDIGAYEIQSFRNTIIIIH